ncbi:MAG TPA: superoxide dismutase family protein [Rhodopila sp.]|jgi:Cu-Zn family superoxide dismutase|nr:superoxide dismutase family protein [Rhodopila sp.]
MHHPTRTTLTLLAMAIAITIAWPAMAANITVTMRKVTQAGTSDTLGTVTITASDAGAIFQLDLHGLPPGPHGFEVHENDNCGPTFINGIRIPGGAAGAPFDPDLTGKHAGPTGDGDLGDLPVMDVAANGTATQTLTAPRIKDINVLKKHGLIIHTGGDNYSDSPNLNGGQGGRLACGGVE